MKKNKLKAFFICPLKDENSEERKRSNFVKKNIIEAAIGNSFEIKHADELVGRSIIHNNIIEELKSSDLVIADLTDLNPNVFYELGVRHYTGKPTILIAEQGVRTPFDVNSMPIIFYSTYSNFEDCISRIRNDTNALLKRYEENGFCENIAFQNEDSIQKITTEKFCCIGQRTSENVRQTLFKAYEESSEIDVFAMTGETSTEVLDLFKSKLLCNKRNIIRILALNPKSPLVKARFSYIRNGKTDHFYNRSDFVYKKYKSLYEEIKNDKNKININASESMLLFKHYDDIPYFSYIRCDNKIFLSIYTATKVTRDSFVFCFEENNYPEFCSTLEEQFNAIWNDKKTVPVIAIDSGTIGL